MRQKIHKKKLNTITRMKITSEKMNSRLEDAERISGPEDRHGKHPCRKTKRTKNGKMRLVKGPLGQH